MQNKILFRAISFSIASITACVLFNPVFHLLANMTGPWISQFDWTTKIFFKQGCVAGAALACICVATVIFSVVFTVLQTIRKSFK